MSASYFMLKFLKQRKLKMREQMKQKSRNNVSQIYNNTDDFICRICLKIGNISIFTCQKISLFPIDDAIRTFGEIAVDENDNFPKYLCNSCYSLLQGAVLFRKSAKESQEILQNNVIQNSLNPKVIELNNSDHNSDNDDQEQVRSESESESNIDKRYSCSICTLNFKNWNKYVSHKNARHHKKVRIQCPICYRLLTSQLYKKHLARHQSASHLICDVCGKLYRKDNLVRHLQLHSYELPYQCQVCPYRGRFMESLKIHMRTHTGDKPFVCDKCELRFLTRSNLNRHLLTHKKERPFKCNECSRGFYTKHDADVHFKSDHAGIKDFGCRECGNKYGTRKALMRHELRVHKRAKLAKGRMPLYLQAEYRKN